MVVQNTTELERVRYWQGQLLASGDLETQLRVDQEMRRLHNRAVHQAYGVAIGLTLERDETTSEIKLDEEGRVNLFCGMAYDCAGRELILQSNRAIPLPPQFPMTLVITRDGASTDGIALNWKEPQAVNANTEIALATLIDGGLPPEADPFFRQVVARPLARPRLATGQTIPGETAWQPWKIGETEVGVKVEIDTSAAGFTRSPHYFAEVVPGKPSADFVPAWFASIADQTTQGFTFQLMLRRITRESLDIADPKGQVTQTPTLDQTVTLDAANLFTARDSVARLLPLAEQAAVIKTLSGGNATLEVPLGKFTDDTKEVAFGNARREAVVQKALEKATFFEATVDRPERFAAGDVVVKINGQVENTRPSRVVSVDDTGILELSPAILGLVADDILAVAQAASTVASVNGTDVKVENPALYSVDDVVVQLSGAIETFAPAKIAAKKADGTLALSKAITGLKTGDSLGFARGGANVLDVADNSSEVKIEVDNAKLFRKGDLVAKSRGNDSFSAPVRVQRVFTSGGQNVLTLSSAIPELAQQDIIVAADFRVRATVKEMTAPTTLTVSDGTLFPDQSYVAKIDDLLSASLPAGVNTSSGNKLTIDAQIATLKPGDVIGLCSFPASVTVNVVRDDGSVEVSAPGILREGDLVAALSQHTGISLVSGVSGNLIRFAGRSPGVNVGDRLSVAWIRGAVEVTKGTSDNRVVIAQPTRVRAGDFLADITGWRQMQRAVQFVSDAGNRITVSSILDGLLLNDTVGLASITPQQIFFSISLIQVRLNQPLDLLNGDEVLLIGLDRLHGETQTVFATVVQVAHGTNTILLFIPVSNNFTFRPEDISASVLFVRGKALALIQKHDLFVSWLAVGEPDRMPRTCAGTDDDDCLCGQVKE